MDRLENIGFEKVGRWKLVNGLVDLELTNLKNRRNILYAFVIDGDVMYIGKTVQPLEKRLYGYKYPRVSQTTNIKNNANILRCLSDNKVVEIFALPDSGLHQIGEFHLNLAAGLEDSLISVLSPAWNGAETRTRKVTKDVSKDDNESKTEILKIPSSLDKEDSFDFQLRVTYYNQGFFNVSVKHEHLFPKDGSSLEIYLGKSKELIFGSINRSVNANNTPRVMGRVPLRDWFQRNFKTDGLVSVDILSPNSIWLHRP
ncbi:hypothetical protein A9Q96_00565 [Rhodobacterales bacterium 52_120_T64]|nr:hypothetical protein A9Q96_00565 [Rhodobacterales bacterium 52_120_T64]